MATNTLSINQFKAKRADNFADIYTNNTQFGYTKYDFMMICRRVTLSNDPNNNLLQEVACVSMSPEHAKAVLEALKESIKGYEDDHGTIPTPTDKKPSLASAATKKRK